MIWNVFYVSICVCCFVIALSVTLQQAKAGKDVGARRFAVLSFAGAITLAMVFAGWFDEGGYGLVAPFVILAATTMGLGLGGGAAKALSL